jgi:hypothetical protein
MNILFPSFYGFFAAWLFATLACAATINAADPSLATITDDPGLPRVLLIGDSISMGYTIPSSYSRKWRLNQRRPNQP